MSAENDAREIPFMELYAEHKDLGRMDYGRCLELQSREFESRLAAKSRGEECGGCAGRIFTVEHPAVYTLGKHGRAENLLVGEERLKAAGAEFFRTDRGGDITFHGEGQLVVYPILDLERLGLGLREYIAALEQAVMDTVAEYGVATVRSEGASGVWIEKEGPLRKICAIGVRASRYITMHGLALNVSTDLGRFDCINPCGFTDRGVASLEGELGYAPAMDEVKGKIINNLEKNLNVKIYKN